MNGAPDTPDTPDPPGTTPPRPIAVDLAVLLHSLADMLGHGFDRRIRIKVNAPSTCPPVLADPAQLEVALLNIAVNARDAMPTGGLLEFRCDATRTLPDTVRTTLQEPNGLDARYVAIDISDSGGGMSDAVRHSAFEPAFTTKPGNSGLGLSMVRDFARSSGGAVMLRSVLGAGTTLTLFLPQPRTATRPMSAGPAIVATIPAGLSVLLVDDDGTVRKSASRFLVDLGCQVVTASSGEQALQRLQASPGFDLLVSDIALGPGLRGTQLAAEVRRHLPTLPILLMSGYSAELVRADHDTPPDVGLLRKPFGKAALAQAVAKLLGAGSDQR